MRLPRAALLLGLLALSPAAAAQHGGRRRHAAPMPSPAPRAGGFARAHLQRCGEGDATACRVAGVHVARGDGGAARNGEAAAQLLERAWTLHRDEGCEWFFTLRQDLPPNAVTRACAHGCSFACEARAMHELAVDPAEGAAALDHLCDRGSAHACYVLGHALLDGALLPRSRRAAVEHIGRACDLGGSVACFEMTLERWDQELLRARRAAVSPERLLATAPLSALRRAATRAPGASPPSRPTPDAPPRRRAERSDETPPRRGSARERDL
jgi:hypothetical protein